MYLAFQVGLTLLSRQALQVDQVVPSNFKYCQILFACTSNSLPFLEDPFLLVDPEDLRLQDFHRLLGHPFLLKLQVNHADQANPRI